jgi:hypothetical protein
MFELSRSTMKNLLPLAVFVLLLAACSKKAPVTTVVSVDSLINNWNAGWNQHDSAAVRKMFDKYPVVIDDNLVIKDLAGIAAQWIHPNIRAVSNLKTVQLQGWANDGKAGYLGTYTFDRAGAGKFEGIVSMSWKKTEDGPWKITNVHLHSFKK